MELVSAEVDSKYTGLLGIPWWIKKIIHSLTDEEKMETIALMEEFLMSRNESVNWNTFLKLRSRHLLMDTNEEMREVLEYLKNQ